MKTVAAARKNPVRAVLGLALALGAADPVGAAVSEASAKAVLVFHLTQFVSWPAPVPGGAFKIGVLGPDPFGPALDEVVAGETIDGRPIQIKRSPTAAGLADCQIVYVAADARESPARVVEDWRGQPILTVGETDRFFDAGGMVRLRVTPEHRIRLQVNLEGIRAAGLKMSAQLLRVAEVVKRRSP